ncbi:L,D-transpeptidase family protein [Roseibium suaedae]|uniref:Murein L,D-transpeptidase YcbB/YkuD n=1 Tax=Roseibium suaedae TaxID=735517 RepID=A0A1M7LMW3_9HYPH|nr:L,D-transpeptidase family protein [Roseibium suaedae]SHM79554.1 Murein L,D-transpeptidase YcbB/YkuD [Roseibium suaedae]
MFFVRTCRDGRKTAASWTTAALLLAGASLLAAPLGVDALAQGALPVSKPQAAARTAPSTSAAASPAPANALPAAQPAAPAFDPATLPPLSAAVYSALQARTVPEKIALAYQARQYKPLWLDDDGVFETAHLAINAFASANDHALNPENYDPIGLAARVESAATEADKAQLDVDLSLQFVRYATHLSSGRVQPNEVNKALNIFPHVPDPLALLQEVGNRGSFADVLDNLAPISPSYARLKLRLAQYREKAANGGFTVVPDGEVLKPGMTDVRVPVLAQRMEQEDYLEPGAHSGEIYDGTLVQAVKDFQSYHGLSVDAVIGKETLAQINVPIRQRLIQMELNMERRRWMPDDLGDTYIFVNLADQNLKVVKQGHTMHTARVVVGKPFHATPVFSHNMTYVEINPYWTVPSSIATNEYLPKLRKDPTALSAQNIRIFKGDTEVAPTQVAWNSYSAGNFPFRLRQDPGKSNALGRIKFMFPNKFNIYIHDTPSKSLFSQSERFFSHGCIRVSDPFGLAEVLLGDQGYSLPQLDALRDSGERKVITLKTPIPVHLTYLTAWMNKDGSTHFRKDIYGRDETLLKALAKAMTDNL